MALSAIMTTSATTRGGRGGRAVVSGGGVARAMALPELGGAEDGMKPEQPFAHGHSACFDEAMPVVATSHGVDGRAPRVTAGVMLDADDGGFAPSVGLMVQIPGVDRATAGQVAHAAHEICLYSEATRGTIPVTVTVV